MYANIERSPVRLVNQTLWIASDLQYATGLGNVHIGTSTSHVSGFRFTARTSFTRTNGAFMVTTPAHTPQRVSTDNLQ